MPYVQASPRVRTGYAAPLFSAFAFVVAAGLSLDGSPFRERTAAVLDDAMRRSCESSCAMRAFDPALAGVYDTTWGVIVLDADGSARGTPRRFTGETTDQPAEPSVAGRWHVTHEPATMIHFEWATGSYAAVLEWWRPSSPSSPSSPASRAAGAH